MYVDNIYVCDIQMYVNIVNIKLALCIVSKRVSDCIYKAAAYDNSGVRHCSSC
jgi:hypothetical protein